MAIALALGIAAVVGWFWRGVAVQDHDGSSPPRVVTFPPPPIALSDFQNTGPNAQYVGSQRCVECHAGEHASYLTTGHSRSMSVVDPQREPPDGEYRHTLSGRRYRAYREGGQLRHRESLMLADGDVELSDYPLKLLVGSGRFSRTYLVEDQGFLVESPLTWYASLNAWAMSPGYDQASHRSFQRAIKHDCLYCHAGSVEPIGNSNERFRLGETAIGCERCHGPGSPHVARWEVGAVELGDRGDTTIVNPRRLPRELAEAVCYQCHLSGEAQVAVRGRRRADFRPGLRWQDFVTDYAFETAATDMTVVGHVAQLRQSPCYQHSETLTCITCHDPHDPPSEPVAYHRKTCVSCHAEPSCGVPLPERTAENGNDCAACHMPQSPTEVPHVAFTHHRIGIHRPSDEEKPEAGFRRLTPMLDVSHLPEIDRDRSLGLAYLDFYRLHPNQAEARAYLAEAQPLLESTAAQGLTDARVTMALAQFAGEAGDLSQAAHWAQQTLAAEDLTPEDRTAALRLLVDIALRQQRLPQTQAYLGELTTLRRDPGDWFLLGLCRRTQGDLRGAAEAWERVVAIDPARPETYQMLAPLYRALNDPAREKWSQEQARKILQAN